MPKITFMGAGSTVFAKNVLGDSMLTPALAESTIALYDIDAKRLEESYLMLTSINNTYGSKARIEKDQIAVLGLGLCGYGEGEEISAFLEEMAKAMPYDHLCTMLGKKMPLTPDEAEKLTEGREALGRFRDKLFEYNPEKAEHRLNCFYFREYLDILEFIQTALLEKAENTPEEETKKKVDSLFQLTHRKEAVMPAILSARAITKFFQWLV